MKGILFFVITGLFAYAIHDSWVLLPIITGYGAKYMCSAVFIAGHNEQKLRQEDLDFFPITYATFTINYSDLSVSGSVFGFAQSKAIYRNGLGATLINELTEKQIRAQTFRTAIPLDINQDTIPWPMGDKIADDSFPSNINQTQLEDAINYLFIERDVTKLIRTRAVVVVYDRKLIAEQYAPGFTRRSKFLGWSMTKSIISALIGILVNNRKLNIDEPAPVPEWNNTDDPRHAITIKNLLQQTSGLNFKEDYYSKSDVTHMLFGASDMAAFAASRPLKNKPGTECYYTSGNTNILSRIIRHTVGEARFGMLYLNNGVYNNERILSEDWIKQTITLGGSNAFGEYGFQFWLNTGKNNDSSTRRYPDVPADMFYASGFDGQSVFIIPSKKLVVVRLGLTKKSAGKYGANEFLKQIISSIE
jgi:CubicO group peptidase (beta-lactamase class C family)